MDGLNGSSVGQTINNMPNKSAYMKAWRKSNKEHIRRTQKEWQKALRERIKKDPVALAAKKAYLKDWYSKNYDKVRESVYRRKYGISYSDALAIWQAQNKLCAICKIRLDFENGVRGKDGVNIDHDHKTGRIRGILCAHCNNMLGCAKDNIDTLRSGITYLENK